MVKRLSALRDEAETAGFTLLTYLIEVALVEAERIAEPCLVTDPTGSAEVKHDPAEERPGE